MMLVKQSKCSYGAVPPNSSYFPQAAPSTHSQHSTIKHSFHLMTYNNLSDLLTGIMNNYIEIVNLLADCLVYCDCFIVHISS